MDISVVYDIIHKISSGFESSVSQCLDQNSDAIVLAIQEQIYCGQDGNGEHLSPTYDDDAFFEERGFWYHRSAAYKAWKNSITPPIPGTMLGLSPRPDNVPNLYIDGTFHSQITATLQGDTLYIDPGVGHGLDIVGKYGDSLLDIGIPAIKYFNWQYLMPSIEDFFKRCGYI